MNKAKKLGLINWEEISLNSANDVEESKGIHSEIPKSKTEQLKLE